MPNSYQEQNSDSKKMMYVFGGIIGLFSLAIIASGNEISKPTYTGTPTIQIERGDSAIVCSYKGKENCSKFDTVVGVELRCRKDCDQEWKYGNIQESVNRFLNENDSQLSAKDFKEGNFFDKGYFYVKICKDSFSTECK